MNYSTYRFTLDLQKHQSQMSIAVFRYDTAVKLYISLTDGGKPYLMKDGCKAYFFGKRADGAELVHPCMIQNNTEVIYAFEDTTSCIDGIVDCQIRLYGTDGRLITAPRFIIVVDERVIIDENVEITGNTLSALDEILTNETARVDAENRRVEAEEERKKLIAISSIEQTEESTEDGGKNVITVTKSDGTQMQFSVRNGSRGVDGATSGTPLYLHSVACSFGEDGSYFSGFLKILSSDPKPYTIDDIHSGAIFSKVVSAEGTIHSAGDTYYHVVAYRGIDDTHAKFDAYLCSQSFVGNSNTYHNIETVGTRFDGQGESVNDGATDTVVQVAKMLGTEGVKKINAEPRRFTAYEWKSYGTPDRIVNWMTGEGFDNSKINVGDTVYITGTVSDLYSAPDINVEAAIYGVAVEVTSEKVTAVSSHVIMGGAKGEDGATSETPLYLHRVDCQFGDDGNYFNGILNILSPDATPYTADDINSGEVFSKVVSAEGTIHEYGSTYYHIVAFVGVTATHAVFDAYECSYRQYTEDHNIVRCETRIDGQGLANLNLIRGDTVVQIAKMIGADLGDIDTALDSIIAIQESLIGGAS